MKAFFVDGLDLTDTAVLVRVAAEAGLDRDEAAACVADEELRRTVAEEEDKARRMGVQGVPFFIFNNRLAVEGAQPADVLLDAMLEAKKEPSPSAAA
jgi:predicted DsbA family dithiol-disulfide isomerase